MRELLVIGMGPGHPDQITVQAVQALNRVDVFFRIDKGEAKSGLNEAREEILGRHVTRPGGTTARSSTTRSLRTGSCRNGAISSSPLRGRDR